MANVIDDARRLKSQAMDARDRGDFVLATSLIESAVKQLTAALDELKSNRPNTERPGRFEVDIANQLVHILGSKGGIFRRHKGMDNNYEASADAYDAGYEFEKPESIYGIVNSYNLVQRLVSRILVKPECVEDENIEVRGLSVRRELLKAKEEIYRQIRGKRAGDEYAAADYALVCLLLGDGWEQALDDFLYATPPPQRYAVKVTSELIEELRAALEQSSSAPRDLKQRLALASQELSVSGLA